jgi:sporulation protein YlmC with PRC-barrel domain
MRLSELIGTEVRDGNDRPIGVVRDVRAIIDEDANGRWRGARVDAILVAPSRSVWPRVQRPLVLGWLQRRFEASSRVIPLERVVSIEPRMVRVRATAR